MDRHVVVGTAGHIDHGKSTLVHALTGVDPDRLAEEKRRGITIELGFADLDLGDGASLSFVDVPGHERFVRRMVAGASGIDAVLLVVAADRGVEPQTREHLEICALLGVRAGVVALTKTDAVDAELAEVAALELRETLAGTFLEGAPVVPVSAPRGEGLDALRAALGALVGSARARPSTGFARLSIDRSFVLRGFGTVVTGTLVAGRLRVGDEIEILPGRRRGRIRGLETHRRSVEELTAGHRAAVNLQGLSTAEAPRGATVAHPGTFRTTRRLLARVRAVAGAEERLRRGGDVRLHVGTADVAATLRTRGVLEDGTLAAELRLAEPLVAALGDRFILRRPAPVDTLGGGRVVDAAPPRLRGFPAERFAAVALEPGRAAELRLDAAGEAGVEPAACGAVLGVAAGVLRAKVLEVAPPLAVEAAGRWFPAGIWRERMRATLDRLAARHAGAPLVDAFARETLRAEVAPAMPQEAWRELLGALLAEGAIRVERERIALAGHRVEPKGEDRVLAERLEDAFRTAGLEPPALDDLVAEEERPRAEALVELLLARGALVRIRDRRLFHAEPLEALRRRLRARAATDPRIDVAGFKELAGVTRKNAIPLLEQFDDERLTRRRGDEREILETQADPES